MLLLLLAALAAVSVWLSALPPVLLLAIPLLLLGAWPATTVPRELMLRSDGSSALVSAEHEATPLEQLQAQFRGPLVVLSYQVGGRTERHVLLPDTLEPQSRRRLRLWTERHCGPARPVVGAAGV